MSKLTAGQLERSLLAACELLRGHLDASEARPLVFGLFFLKTVHDRFLEAREALPLEEAEDASRYADAYFVPPEARWTEADGADGPGLGELTEGLGAALDAAMAAIEEANEEANEDLRGVLSAVRFEDSGLSDEVLAELVAQFTPLALGAQSVEYPDLVGAAADRLLEHLADEAGKKSESFTPPWVARLLVRLLHPESGTSVYDPAAGMGGLLVQAWQHVQRSSPFSKDGAGYDVAISLTGREIDPVTFALGRMNLLLHGIGDAELLQEDALAAEAGARYERVLAHTPFFQDKKGKKSDLQFVQHMVGALSSTEAGDERDGRMAVLLPQAVLFRGGPEQAIRKQLVDEGLLEAVVALPPSLFGAGAPAAILMLSNAGRAERSQVLFVGAGREVRAGRGQGMRPEDIEKLVVTWRRRAEVDGYSRLVPVTELVDADYNLDLRKHLPGAAEPEPHDVTAHLHGGIPEAEIERLDRWLKHYGGVRKLLFVSGKEGHARVADGMGKADLAAQIASAKGVQQVREKLLGALEKWWETAEADLASLPESGDVFALERRLLKGLPEALPKQGALTDLQVRGALMRFYDDEDGTLKTIASRGWSPTLVPADAILTSQRPELVQQLEEKRARIREIEALFSAARAREDSGDEEGEEVDASGGVLSPSEAKALKERQKKSKADLSLLVKQAKALITYVWSKMQRWGGSAPKEYTKGLTPTAPDFSGPAALLEEVGDNPDVAAQVEELQQLIERGEKLNEEHQSLEAALSAHKATEAELRQLKTEVKEIEAGTDRVVDDARSGMQPDAVQALVLQRLKGELLGRFEALLLAEQQAFTDAVVALVDKYAEPFHTLEERRSERLAAFLEGVEDSAGDPALLDALIADSEAVTAKLKLLKEGLTAR